VWASVACCRPAPGPVPIGRPIANTRIYLLDTHGELVPVGVTGEIHIAGAGVARGYLNRPELTAERFLPDPFGPPGARLYKTGDLARHRPDGNLEFLGRNDFQIKIRGFRIELGEIEARLVQYPGIREAVVLAREDGAGEKRLVAYYTATQAQQETASEGAEIGIEPHPLTGYSLPESNGAFASAVMPTDTEKLRVYLLSVLPEHMIPTAYVKLDALPLTANGKLDRNALPAPEGTGYAARGYEAPVGEIETALAQIWGEILGLERVGRNDHFFELGGHSLLVVKVASRVRQVLGAEVSVPEIFDHPVLSDIAEVITAALLASLTPADLKEFEKEP
jgi:acyl-coenzyme A synthetase/AMP-(fatty) acid ligase